MKRLTLPLLAATVATLAAALVAFAGGASARPATGFVFVVHNRGIEYVTAAGGNRLPTTLQIGDRIYTRDDLLVGKTKIGYDNELCTATFDGNDLCHVIAVITGKGTLEINWLWAGRNNSTYGPPHFSGVIDGGTGAYANAKGQFDASLFADGQLRFTAKLG
jgi:hypothetical protein